MLRRTAVLPVFASSNYYTFTTPERFGLHRSCNPKRMKCNESGGGGAIRTPVRVVIP
jgi:hypothetical protein